MFCGRKSRGNTYCRHCERSEAIQNRAATSLKRLRISNIVAFPYKVLRPELPLRKHFVPVRDCFVAALLAMTGMSKT